MVGSFVRLAAAAAFCAALAGCAGSPNTAGRGFDGTAVATPEVPLQCVPYARERSHIPLYGDAATWWQKAEGRFARSAAPSEGAVMVLHNYAGSERAHLAVVSRIVDSRELRIDHANWLDDGAIYVNDPVRDVSPDNDWSEVRVYNTRAGTWGVKIYPVLGFIGPGPDSQPDSETVRLAQSQTAAPAAPKDDIARLLTPGPRPNSQTERVAQSPTAATAPQNDDIAGLLSTDPDLDDSDN